MLKSNLLRGAMVVTVVFGGAVMTALAQPQPRIAPPPASPPMSDSTRSGNDTFRPPSMASKPAPPVQRRGPTIHGTICGNPQVTCRTEVTFRAWDLPFRGPRNAVIYDTELFYAVVLKSVSAPDDNCDVFISEDDRLAAQTLFPDRKVFASRCAEPDSLFYSNTKPNFRIMAVYAGKTLVEAKQMLEAVKATGKFPGANVRRMRTGFNGT